MDTATFNWKRQLWGSVKWAAVGLLLSVTLAVLASFAIGIELGWIAILIGIFVIPVVALGFAIGRLAYGYLRFRGFNVVLSLVITLVIGGLLTMAILGMLSNS